MPDQLPIMVMTKREMLSKMNLELHYSLNTMFLKQKKKEARSLQFLGGI
jgi:hypothetical protein